MRKYSVINSRDDIFGSHEAKQESAPTTDSRHYDVTRPESTPCRGWRCFTSSRWVSAVYMDGPVVYEAGHKCEVTVL